MPKIYDDISLSIGNTPLVRLNKIADGNIYVKVEGRNPCNSVKCRIGANMIWEAEKDGRLKPGMMIVEATSGNTGIALAFVAASRGYSITLTMPHTMSLERRKLMVALGAKIVLSDGALGMKGALAKAEEIAAAYPANHFIPSQFDNPANPAIHEKTTGPEIWDDTSGEVDVLVSGVGTGGTITGVSRYIKKEKGKQITSVAVEPASSPQIKCALEGMEPSHAPHKIQGIGAGFIPANLDLEMVDQTEQISDDEAMEYAHKLMEEEGILAGISSGAAVAAAVRISKQAQHKGKMIVVILPDSGERYLSTALFSNSFSENEMEQLVSFV